MTSSCICYTYSCNNHGKVCEVQYNSHVRSICMTLITECLIAVPSVNVSWVYMYIFHRAIIPGSYTMGSHMGTCAHPIFDLIYKNFLPFSRSSMHAQSWQPHDILHNTNLSSLGCLIKPLMGVATVMFAYPTQWTCSKIVTIWPVLSFQLQL